MHLHLKSQKVLRGTDYQSRGHSIDKIRALRVDFGAHMDASGLRSGVASGFET